MTSLSRPPADTLDYPFLRPEFFAALEDSGSVCSASGWTPHHLNINRDGRNLAFMPLYLKTHSWGEYVFDWSWADAYRRHGLEYYPKLLSAIPFTPATGPRIRFAEGADQPAVTRQLVNQVIELAQDSGASGWHLLFPEQQQLQLLETCADDPHLMCRTGVQYHWFNVNQAHSRYQSFEDFLAALSSRKRKMIRRERRQVAEQGFHIEVLGGDNISAGLWEFFYQVYHRTYLKRSGSAGYLSRDFFHQIGATMPEQVAMAVAYSHDKPVAAALYFFDNTTLYGRYWGCEREYDFLHFELCYYRGIDFAIARGLHKFDAGAQGEHKILRGFTPVETHSLHWIANPAFAEAVGKFLLQEQRQMERYREEAAELLPFKNAQV